MKIRHIGGYTIGISSASDLLAKHYAAEPVNLSKMKQVGKEIISKADAKGKIISQPYSMVKLLDLYDTDEYHSGCIDAISIGSILQFTCKNTNVSSWLKAAQYPACENEATIVTEMLKFYLCCGNGFLIKMRNAQGAWVGLERMLPSEVQIVEAYDEFGFARPNYIQTKNSKKMDFLYKDIIHLKKSTHKSNAWGLACLPVAINNEILAEIKTFDYNNFKNGLLVDYFMIVEGGTLRDGTALDADGNEVISDAFEQIQAALTEAKGTAKAHSTILIESESKDVKIRLEPLRQNPEGGFLTLKKDLREGIFAYHRVPPRLVSQLVSGQLGGDNDSDMRQFYQFVVRPLQYRLALTLAYEFMFEYPSWNVSPEDFDFGNIADALASSDEKLFGSLRSS